MLRDDKLNCVDLFFRSLDMASLNCLLRIGAVQFHLILVALSFSLTISYPFYLNSTMRDIAICAICVAHLSSYVAIYFSIAKYRNSLLNYKLKKVLSLLDNTQPTDSDRRITESYVCLSFVLMNIEYTDQDIKNCSTHLRCIRDIMDEMMNSGYDDTYAQVIVLVVLYAVDKQSMFKEKLASNTSVITEARGRFPQYDDDTKQDIKETLDFLESVLRNLVREELKEALDLTESMITDYSNLSLQDIRSTIDYVKVRVKFANDNSNFMSSPKGANNAWHLSDDRYKRYLGAAIFFLGVGRKSKGLDNEKALGIFFLVLASLLYDEKLIEYSTSLNDADRIISTYFDGQSDISELGIKIETKEIKSTVSDIKERMNKLMQDPKEVGMKV